MNNFSYCGIWFDGSGEGILIVGRPKEPDEGWEGEEGKDEERAFHWFAVWGEEEWFRCSTFGVLVWMTSVCFSSISFLG